MAYAFFDLVPTTNAWAIYELKELLVAQGWTVLASGDGLAAYGAASDVITSGNSGANGMANTTAWFRITSPDAQIEFTIQRGTTNYLYRVKYSRAGKFGGGAPSATQTPSAADEQTILGGGTDAAPTYGSAFHSSDGVTVYKAGADDASPYTFYLVGTTPGGENAVPTSNGPRSAWILDACVDLAPGDAEPYAHYISISAVLLLSQLYSISFGPYSFVPSAAPATWQRYGVVEYTQNVSNAAIPNNVPTNPLTKKDSGVSMWLARRTAEANPGYKGRLTMMKWRFFERTNGQTYTVSTSRDRIGFGDVVLPWGGAAPVI